MTLKKLLRFFLGIPLTIIAFLFIGKIFWDGKDQILTSLFSIKPELFLLGILFYSSFFALKSYIWIKILEARGHNPDIRSTIYSYSISEIKRYIPGSIFAFIGRVDTHKSVPKSETLKGIGIEAALLVLSALLISLPAIIFLSLKYFTQFLSIFYPVAFGFILALTLLFFANKKVSAFLKKYLDLFFLFVIAWSLYALGSLLILLSLTFIDPANFIAAASIFAFSWLGGYLLFVTPMGLGARELLAVYGLSFFISPALSSAIAIITRLAMIIGELFYLTVTYAFKELRPSSKILKVNSYLAIVVITSFLYFVFFSYYSILKHDTFLTGRFDLGNMAQTVWNTYHGSFFTLTNPDGVKTISRLGVHSDIFLVFLSPLYLIWESPKMLLIFQSLAIASGGIFVYLIAKKITKKEGLSLVFALSYFSNFWLHEQNLFDFHAVSIATPLLLAAFYVLLKKRAVLFCLFILLAATTKENVLLVISVFGLYFFKNKAVTLGWILTILPLIVFYYLIAFAIPNARGSEHFALETYKYLGSSPLDTARNVFTNPSLIFNQIFNYSTLDYINNHLFPTGYLALLSPFYLLFTLPDAAIYLFSSNLEYRSYQYHFGAVIIPFVYIGAIYSAQKIGTKFKAINASKLLIYYLGFVTIYTLYSYSPIPGLKSGDTTPLRVKNAYKIEEYLTIIPPTADVAASNSIGAHLSHRKKIYVVPYGINLAAYVVLYRENYGLIEKVDKSTYRLLIGDSVNNFYLFKMKDDLSCSSCQP